MTLDARLAIPAVVAWVLTALVIGWRVEVVIVAVALWAAAGICVVVALRVGVLAGVALALAAAALCVTSVAIQSPSRYPQVVTDVVESHRSASVELTTTESVMPGARSFEATLVRINDRVVDVPVIVFGGTPQLRAEVGETLATTASIAPTDLGDDRAFMVFPDDEVVYRAPAPEWIRWAGELRAAFRDHAAGLPGSGGRLLSGLAIGDTTLVDEQLDAAMKGSSLSHLTAVSGANCAIVIGLVLLVGSVVGLPRGVRVGVALVVLVGFVVLVTPEPSVLRAAVMAAIALVTYGFGRPVRGIPVVALAVVVLLVADPWMTRSYGFVLSVLATAGLMVLAGPLTAVLGRFLPRWLALVVAVPMAAQLACQPVVVLLSASLPTYGVIANVLAAPAAPVATIVGLAGCLLLLPLPPLGALLCDVAWLPSAWIAAVAEFFAELPGAQLPWPEGAGGVALLAGVTVLATASLLGGPRLRRWCGALVAIGVVAYVSTIGLGRLLELAGRPPDWQVAACDIGQGDAVLVRSAGHVALIDTGPDPAALRACLSDLGITRLDLLVLTHYDLDHVGGTSAVVGWADRVLVGPSGGADDDRLVTELADGGAEVTHVSGGESGLLGELRWTVLWPPARGAPEPGNSASVVIATEGVGACASGCLSGVFLGDLGEESQRRLLGLGGLSRVDVVKVAHHGSADQSAELYERLAATAGVIGVGVDNGYGHPTASLLGILESTHTAALRTDERGLILLAPGTTPGSVVVWAQRPG